ncbi:polysaccharide deacetylase family protein [Kiritimatiellota bacterium B12222]|nr:polysaccharide deacetylase family protein [Kiritimatiellota bacterium B12222]
MSTENRPAHISIHDVAPETLGQVGDILSRLDAVGVHSVMLLVIPGRAWEAAHLLRLRNWVDRGHVLAGHGWFHAVKERKSFKHQIHGMCISRYVAEHLSLRSEEILELMQRNYDWFALHDLPSPRHYVPPAWALGKLSQEALQQLPFTSVETLRGIYLPQAQRFEKCPLVGYEADTNFRRCFLRLFNGWNRRFSRGKGPLRIGIHPYDFSYGLGDDILRDCQRYRCRASFE